jgi:hypothetical protein
MATSIQIVGACFRRPMRKIQGVLDMRPAAVFLKCNRLKEITPLGTGD